MCESLSCIEHNCCCFSNIICNSSANKVLENIAQISKCFRFQQRFLLPSSSSIQKFMTKARHQGIRVPTKTMLSPQSNGLSPGVSRLHQQLMARISTVLLKLSVDRKSLLRSNVCLVQWLQGFKRQSGSKFQQVRLILKINYPFMTIYQCYYIR